MFLVYPAKSVNLYTDATSFWFRHHQIVAHEKLSIEQSLVYLRVVSTETLWGLQFKKVHFSVILLSILSLASLTLSLNPKFYDKKWWAGNSLRNKVSFNYFWKFLFLSCFCRDPFRKGEKSKILKSAKWHLIS